MKLLEPLQVGNKTLKNRVVSTAHSAFLDFFQPGSNGEQYLSYQERRAAGGTGLIIATAMHVHKSSVCSNHFLYEKDDVSKKLKELSSRVHRYGTTAVSQLFHFGVNGRSDGREDFTPLWGFSGQASSSGEVSHKMTPDEIEEIIQSFVNSAVVAVESGMDGVELHGTHGYLIQQSFSPWGNQRDDEWGEPLRFVRTLARRVREAIGPDKLLGFRISSDDFMTPEQGGLGHEGLCDVVANVVADGHLDYLNHSEGAGGAGYARAIGSFRHPLGEWLPLTRGLKNAIDGAIPVIGVGKIPTVDLAESALQAGDCDLVGMTRAQISDPDLVKKVVEGQAHRIRLCTGANQGCIDRTGSLPITCIHNPEVGQEHTIKVFEKAPKAKKVLVIGAGPAGMKATELACRRGHDVTLADPGSLGGRFNLVSHCGAASNLLASISWLEQELQILKPNIVNAWVDEDFIRDLAPDEIILATGARPSAVLDFDFDESVPLLSTDDAAIGIADGTRIDMRGARGLFVDLRNNNETSLVLESLANRGSQITYSTPASFGANLGFTHVIDLMSRLPGQGVELLDGTTLQSVRDGIATIRTNLTGRTQDVECDYVIAGVHPTPMTDLYEVGRKYCNVTMVGDVVAPRTALEAFREGDRAGRTI